MLHLSRSDDWVRGDSIAHHHSAILSAEQAASLSACTTGTMSSVLPRNLRCTLVHTGPSVKLDPVALIVIIRARMT